MTKKPQSEFWKFYPINQNFLSVLINEEVWFSHPDRFNDPFDCNIDFKCVLEDLKEFESDPEVHKIVGTWMEPVINDESGYYVYSVVTKTYDEILMWSHYANEHKGVCVGLQLSSFESNSRIDSMGEVLYEEFKYVKSLKKGLELARKYKADILCSDTDAFKRKCDLVNTLWIETAKIRLRTKAPNWKYEDEYRFIIQGEFGNKNGDLVRIEPKDVTSIIYGLKCEEKDQKTVENILKTKGWDHVTRWKAVRGKGLFDLEFQRVNKK